MTHQLPASADVAVIGGGAIGLSVAWRAAELGLKVVVLERDQPGGGTSHLAAGMLAPVAEADPSEQPLLDLGLAAAAGYERFIEELRACTPLDTGYRRCGTLMVARDGDEAEALDRALELRQRLGLRVRRLRPTQARELEPALAPSLRLALELPSDHAVDPRRLTAALADAVVRSGGTVCTGVEVDAVEQESGRVCGVTLHGGARLAARRVVVAAGVWAGQLGGVSSEVAGALRPVKGQILRLRDPTGPGLLERVLRLEGAYLVPRGDGRYVLGATVEERGFDRTVTAGAVRELLTEAAELVPGLDELVLDELAAGLRPGTRDNQPLIGPGEPEGLFWATGHYRNGILLAPLTGELVASLLAEQEPRLDLMPFHPARFTLVGSGDRG